MIAEQDICAKYRAARVAIQAGDGPSCERLMDEGLALAKQRDVEQAQLADVVAAHAAMLYGA